VFAELRTVRPEEERRVVDRLGAVAGGLAQADHQADPELLGERRELALECPVVVGQVEHRNPVLLPRVVAVEAGLGNHHDLGPVAGSLTDEVLDPVVVGTNGVVVLDLVLNDGHLDVGGRRRRRRPDQCGEQRCGGKRFQHSHGTSPFISTDPASTARSSGIEG
jgi:hypothetical protein